MILNFQSSSHRARDPTQGFLHAGQALYIDSSGTKQNLPSIFLKDMLKVEKYESISRKDGLVI